MPQHILLFVCVQCELGSSINYTNITGVLTNTTCWFMVTVKSTTEIDSNNVSCYRYPPPGKLTM